VDEHASSWAAGERFALHGDRSGRLDSAAAVLLLEQWLREGPEPLASTAIRVDPVVPATIAVGTRAGADSF
jgi:putative Holliday junction resolvase